MRGSSDSLVPKRPVNKLVLLLIATVVSIGGYVFVRFTLAANGSLYLQPASQTVLQNANLAVKVRVNTGGTAANVVQANLSYPSSQLQFISIDATGSAFDSSSQSTGGNGSVYIGRYSSVGNSVNGDQLVATVNFKVLVGSGSGVVSFANGSAIYSAVDSSNILVSTTGGTYTFSSPPPPPVAPPPPPPVAPPPPPPVAPPSVNPPPPPAVTPPAASSHPSTPTSTGPTPKDASSGGLISKDEKNSSPEAAPADSTEQTGPDSSTASISSNAAAQNQPKYIMAAVTIGFSLVLLVGLVVLIRLILVSQARRRARAVVASSHQPQMGFESADTTQLYKNDVSAPTIVYPAGYQASKSTAQTTDVNEASSVPSSTLPVSAPEETESN